MNACPLRRAPAWQASIGGDCLAAKLRPGNVHSAEEWDQVLLPEIKRQQRQGKDVVVRASRLNSSSGW